MFFKDKAQVITRETVRFFLFIKRLISGRDPVVVDDPAIAVAVVVVDPAPSPEPVCIDLSGMTLEQITVELDRAFGPPSKASTPAKTPVNSNDRNQPKAQETKASQAYDAAGCLVVVVGFPTPSFPTRPLTLLQRLKASQPSPLSHLLGSPKKPFKLSTFAPSTPWSRSTQAEKDAQVIRSSQARKSVAISVNLSPAREKTLRSTMKPAALLADYVNREMKAELGYVLPFFLQLEFSPGGRLHAHGVACLDRATLAELAALTRALANAAGKIKGREGSTQVKFKELYRADGWTVYFSKTAARTIKLLGTDRITAVSSAIRSLAEADWTNAHAATKPTPATLLEAPTTMTITNDQPDTSPALTGAQKTVMQELDALLDHPAAEDHHADPMDAVNVSLDALLAA